MRGSAVDEKFKYDRFMIEGQNIVLVDDSIVRLITLPRVVKQLSKLGAREVHVRIGCPPITHPCIYGIDTPTKAELVAANLSLEEIRAASGATSLQYLSQDGLERVAGMFSDRRSFCYGCLTGEFRLPS